MLQLLETTWEWDWEFCKAKGFMLQPMMHPMIGFLTREIPKDINSPGVLVCGSLPSRTEGFGMDGS